MSNVFKTNLAILGVLALSASASADTKPKYTRQQDVKIDVKLSDRVKPIQQAAPDPKNTQPTLSADDVLSIEGLVGNIRGEQEQILAQIIANTPDSDVDEKSDAYFR